jgi:hypothetical protein
MKLFLIGMLLSLCAVTGWAQDGVTVSSNSVVVTAVFGDFTCNFVGPIFVDLEHVTCFRGSTEVLFTRLRPQVGQDLTGSVGPIQWDLTQPTKGVFVWKITLPGGIVQTGTF